MSRDDSILHTGATSASFASPKEVEVKAKQAEAKEKRREVGHKLKPAGEVVLGLIANQKDKIKSIEEFGVEDMVTEEHFKSEVMARKKFYQYLLTFEQEIKNKLKEPSDG